MASHDSVFGLFPAGSYTVLSTGSARHAQAIVRGAAGVRRVA